MYRLTCRSFVVTWAETEVAMVFTRLNGKGDLRRNGRCQGCGNYTWVIEVHFDQGPMQAYV